ncbi:putative P-loop containing nucleoside triphosphate hydrolase, leucine-rich repeat domain superfamily [Helianthus annuus]|nr:putative P-loop containing nucleoside triphosphate hydrolase, leucine-rich repeat domain superfamily [Helianthus annuus]
MIALCGMGGVGKTTMMEQLKKAMEDSKMFDWVVKVVLGESTDPFVLQQAVAEYIHQDLTEKTIVARAELLRKKFEGMSQNGQKKILVIMDDIWKEVDLKDVGLTSPLPNGFKLLFTSRFEPICTRMGAWKKVLKRLEKADLKDLESITYKIFEISYENLKEGDDKAIFLLSALFPDDFNIRTEDLFRLGWGLGFLTDGKTLGEARSDMKICVNNLLHANLLTKSDRMGCVKMHDLVRAFVLNRISEVKQASIVNIDNIPEQYANETYERILLKCTGMTEFPSDFNYPNLSLLMLMDGDEVFKFPEDIYKRMEKLEVLSYEDLHIPLLPRTSEHSTKLRTLCLRSCSFINDDVSFLGSLTNLETLSFVDCGITWLPSTIGKLRKLKLLDLTGCFNLRIDDGVFQDLHSLEELYLRAYDDSPIRFTDANCDELEKLSHRLFALELEFFENKAQPKNISFGNLERFRISIGCTLKELKDAEKCSFENTIRFSGDCHELMECKINALFEKTEELYLRVNEMNNLKDVSTCHSFSNLRVLHVHKCEDLMYLFTVAMANGMKELERLTISKCRGMRTLVAENSRVGVIRFHKLSFLSLSDLPEMVSLWDNVIELPELVELELHKLPNFTSIYPESHSTPEVQSLLNKKVLTSKLKKLDISTEDLLRFGWGLGFLKDGKTLREARRDMEICVNNLLCANLLTKSDLMGCVKVHDLVRAFVLNKISEVKQASIVNIDNKSEQCANETYERILLKCTGMTEFPRDFNYPNLSLLMLMDGHRSFKFPEDIYQRMEKLEVVSYEKMHIPLLPRTSEHSTKLRTLCLRSCSIINDDVSFLGSLTNLETLSFVDCGITWLPSKIGNLKKLKLLDLSGFVHLRIDTASFKTCVVLKNFI